MVIKLRDIIENKRKEIEEEKKRETLEQLKEKIKFLPPTRNFLKSISKEGINIIAETKVDSPSYKKPNKERSMYELSKYYETPSIAAISVLTDNKYFGGSKEEMQEIRKDTNKPILRKDFIIDEYQIYQSRAYGADAILLISSVLTKEQMRYFVDLSGDLGMECLVEYSDLKGQAKIPDNVKIYGRNYRKLLLDTDLSSDDIYDDPLDTEDINQLPPDAIKVAESQINIENISSIRKKYKFNAFLIGTTITKSEDIAKTIEKLVSA